MNISNNKGLRKEPFGIPSDNLSREFARILSWHASGNDPGSPQEAHMRTNLHCILGVSQLAKCEVSCRKFSQTNVRGPTA